MKITLAFALAAGLLLAAGCETSSHKLPPPKSSLTLVLDPNQRQVLKSVPLGSQLRVVLPTPEAGPPYLWEIVSNNVRITVQTSELAPLPHPTAKQAYAATFQTINSGRSVLRFAAVKPGGGEQEPDDLYQVVVGVKSPDE